MSDFGLGLPRVARELSGRDWLFAGHFVRVSIYLDTFPGVSSVLRAGVFHSFMSMAGPIDCDDSDACFWRVCLPFLDCVLVSGI